ncbi:MAG: FKBP-type peptidyl-prolyl cis-trans isomerase [Bacteroidales bacterium]
MNIDKNKVVELSFQLRLNGYDGELIQEFAKDEPFRFIFGVGQLLESFENKLFGLSKGQTFKFMLPVVEAYGEVDEEAIIDFPPTALNIEKDYLYVGSVLPFKDDEGNEMEGTIVEITDNAISIDFNHPLAGQDLYFEGKIENVRDATPEELAHGHVH